MSIIKPEVGRTLYFVVTTPDDDHPDLHVGHKHAAKIVYVHSERLVNLTVFDVCGECHGRTGVVLRQPNDPLPTGVISEPGYAEWMPFTVASEQKRQQQEQTEWHAQALAAV